MATTIEISENIEPSSRPNSSQTSERRAVGRRKKNVVEGRSPSVKGRKPTKSKAVVMRYRSNGDGQLLSFGAIRVFDDPAIARRFARDRNGRTKKFRYVVKLVPYANRPE